MIVSVLMQFFTIEVGTEELLASFVGDAIRQWQTLIPKSLSEQFLTSEAIHVYGTPRRLTVLIQGLADRQPDRVE